MPKNPDVLVVGGGIIGCAIAWRLAGEGLSVTLLEKGDVGGEASWAAGGILTPVHLPDYPTPLATLCAASMELYPTLVDEIQSTAPADPEYRTTGLIILVTDDEGDSLANRLRHPPPPRVRREYECLVGDL